MTQARVLFTGVLLIVLLMFALSACTRQRPAVEPETIWTPQADVAAQADLAEEAEEVDAEVEASPEVDADGTPLPPSPALTLTPTPEPETDPEAAPETPAEAPQYTEYAVAAGDTLFSIAMRFDTDVRTLQRLNLIEGDEIYVGQQLRVPARGEAAPTPTPEPLIHVVQSGETLFSIALRYDLSTDEVARANNISDPNAIYVGQRLMIPGAAAAPPPAPEESTVHVVQRGETLFSIARRYDVSTDDVARANNIRNPNAIYVGQRLVIPGASLPPPSQEEPTTHVVQPGESLLGIALRYGVTVNELVRANNLTDPDQIRVGQTLIIPN